ncbi:MAG: hypothetical protein K1X29_05810 [Bdellovibrionales bacterium]|nr:hypothetical protein [Bdellovibrionales bacterium]
MKFLFKNLSYILIPLLLEGYNSYALGSEAPFKYNPADKSFWNTTQNKISQNKFDEVLLSSFKKNAQSNNTIESAEAQLALAQGLMGNKYEYLPYLILKKIALQYPGTSVAESALYELSQLDKTMEINPFDKEDFIIQNDFGPVHPEISAFLATYRSFYALKKGFTGWVKEQIKLIDPEPSRPLDLLDGENQIYEKGADKDKDKDKDNSTPSYWSYLLRFQSAVDLVKSNHLSQAEGQFKMILENNQNPIKIKNQARRQLARIYFEQGRFNEAYNEFTQLESLSLRDQGALYLEMAWTKFYLKDYFKALGHLAALRAPYFVNSLSPERFVLEVLILRELCRYEDVQTTVNEFNNVFSSTLSAIKSRKPLRENSTLLNLTLLENSLQIEANSIDLIRKEKFRFLNDKNLNGNSFLNSFFQEYSNEDQRLQKVLDLKLEEKAKEVAEMVLETNDQMQFISYVSQLDRHRLNNSEKENISEKPIISPVHFTHLYWPVTKEYWWSELNDFEVYASSQCQQTIPMEWQKMETHFK